jgi:(1->4)-alpha-D-glucan 1-alpha-D-glucosylmutase
VRARLCVLSERPDRWRDALKRMAAAAIHFCVPPPSDRGTEYFIYQTLVGCWPISEERLLVYLQKAVREAKVHTSWTRPNEQYETMLADFVKCTLGDEAFRKLLDGIVDELRVPAERNALAQLVLKLTAPGVPDTYQGCEVFRYDLTDPDNRRDVDFVTLTKQLATLEGLGCDELIAKNDADLRKLYITHKLLSLRRNSPEKFGADAAYRPLSVAGKHAERVVAFARGDDLLVAVPRLAWQITDSWGDTKLELPAGTWDNLLCPGSVGEGRAETLFNRLPVAVLVRRKA